MNEIQKLLNLQSFSTRELENTIQNSFSKRKTRQPRFMNYDSEVDVVEPYYFKKHEKLPFLDYEKCRGCKNKKKIKVKKHEYLKRKGIDLKYLETSIRKHSQKKIINLTELLKKERQSVIVLAKGNFFQQEIRRKIKDSYEMVQFDTVKNFTKKFKVDCFDKRVREFIITYCLKKYKHQKDLKDIKISISQFITDKDFTREMLVEFPKIVNKKNNLKKKAKHKKYIDTFSNSENLPTIIYNLIKEGKQRILEERQVIFQFANNTLNNFKQENKRLAQLIIKDLKEDNQEEIQRNFQFVIDYVNNFIEGKEDQMERKQAIDELKDEILNCIKKYSDEKVFRLNFKTDKSLSKRLRRKSSFIDQDDIPNSDKKITSIREYPDSNSKHDRKSEDSKKRKMSLSGKKETENKKTHESKKILQKKSSPEILSQQDEDEDEEQEESDPPQNNSLTVKNRQMSPRKSMLASKLKRQTIFASQKHKKLIDQINAQKAKLKSEASSLINQHKQFICQIEESLKSLKFEPFIIKEHDSILIKKKKIRMLREIIKRANDKEELSNQACNEIFQYLEIYENNCRLLLGKKSVKQEEEDDPAAYNLNMARECGQYDLKFFQLSNEYYYGEAQDGLNFYKGESTKKQKKKKTNIMFEMEGELDEERKSEVKDNKMSELVQIDLPMISTVEVVKQNTEREKKRSKILTKQEITELKLKKIKEKIIKTKEDRSGSKKLANIGLLLTQYKNNTDRKTK